MEEEKEKELELEKKLFIFPKWDEKIKYIFIFIICSLMRRLIPRIIECFSFAKLVESKFKFDHYFNLMTNFISDFSVGIILLINKLREHYNNRETYKIVPPTAIKANMKKYFFILFSIIAIIDFIAQFCMFIFPFFDPDNNILVEQSKNTIIKEEDLYFVVLIDIISRYIFSKFILKGHFYRHHILAIIITCIGFIPFIIVNIINIINSYQRKHENENEYKIHRNMIIYLILYITMTIIYSLEDVLNKICLNKLIIKPFELMFYKAVFQIIFVVPLTLYMIIKENISEHFSTNFKGIKILGRVIYRLSFIICNIFRTWSLITIIQLVNPNHLSILKSSEFAILFVVFPIFKYIKEITSDDNDKYEYDFDVINLISGIICFIISFIGSAIHNEIIIINRCGLYECTDFYKIEIKKNEDIDFIEKDDKNSVNRDSLPEDSSSQLTESFY